MQMAAEREKDIVIISFIPNKTVSEMLSSRLCPPSVTLFLLSTTVYISSFIYDQPVANIIQPRRKHEINNSYH